MNKTNNNKSDFSEGILKGRMAETLVEELFKKSGNTVYRFGYEAVLQNLVQLERKFDRDSEVGQRIRAIPDFIVINKDGEPSFVEVKFRWNGELTKDDFSRIEKIEKFWNSPILMVNCKEKPYFKIAMPPYFDSDKKLITKPLIEFDDWKIDPTTYKEAENLVEKYLAPTMKVTGDIVFGSF